MGLHYGVSTSAGWSTLKLLPVLISQISTEQRAVWDENRDDREPMDSEGIPQDGNRRCWDGSSYNDSDGDGDKCSRMSAGMWKNATKKLLERHKHCALAVVRWSQKFSPRRRPPSRGARGPTFNQLEMVTTFTYRPSLVKIDRCMQFKLSW